MTTENEIRGSNIIERNRINSELMQKASITYVDDTYVKLKLEISQLREELKNYTDKTMVETKNDIHSIRKYIESKK